MIKSHTSKQISGVGFFYYGRIEGKFVLSLQLIPFQVRSHSYDPPMFLLTKLDDLLFCIRERAEVHRVWFLVSTETDTSCLGQKQIFPAFYLQVCGK